MPIVKSSVSQQVIDYIKINLANRTWQVGTKIPSENELTKTLGVSRASVRLALQQFIAIGVLDCHHGKGTFVKSDSLDAFANNGNNIGADECKDIAKVLEFRRIIEPESCYLAALRSTPELVGNLRGHLDGMIASIGDPVEFIQQDMSFHLEISKASENPLLDKTLREVFAQTQKNHKDINELFGYKDGVYYHTLIYKAFESGDPKLARKMMLDHILQGLDSVADYRD